MMTDKTSKFAITEIIPHLIINSAILSNFCWLSIFEIEKEGTWWWFFVALLHEMSSQKQSRPRWLLSDIHTRSTMNILILIFDVHVRWILYCAKSWIEEKLLFMNMHYQFSTSFVYLHSYNFTKYAKCNYHIHSHIYKLHVHV